MGKLVVGIDPGWAKPCAYAIADEQKAYWVGFLPSGKDLTGAALEGFKNQFRLAKIHGVFIEAGHAGNTKVLEQMSRAGGMLQMGLGEWPTTHVPYRMWVSSYRIPPSTPKIRAKMMYMNIARMYCPRIDDPTFVSCSADAKTDIAAAICIAVFGARRT